MRKEVIICLDIGGTHCRLGLVDREGALWERQILSTEALAQQGFVPALREKLGSYAAQHRDAYALRAVSMGFPATVDRTRRKVLSAPISRGSRTTCPSAASWRRFWGSRCSWSGT